MSTARRTAARVLRLAGTLLALGVFAGMLVAGAQGVRFLPVLTGSMTPYAPAGSLVLTVPVAGADVAVGDVVAFRPPSPYEVTGDRPIFHRVTGLDSQDGEAFMTTRGDANPADDPWRVATDGQTFGHGVLVVPWLGRLFAGGTHAALALVLGTGALLAGIRAFRRTRAARRVPAAHAVTVAVHVPAAEWCPVDGPRLARTKARAALAQGLAAEGLVLARPPVLQLEDDGRGGARMQLSARAVPA